MKKEQPVIARSDRAFQIVELIKAHGPQTDLELCDRLGLPQAAASDTMKRFPAVFVVIRREKAGRVWRFVWGLVDQRIETPGPDESYCCTCKRYRPLAMFGKNKNTKNGVGPVCKPCSTDYEKERRRKKGGKNRATQDPALLAQGLRKCTHCGKAKDKAQFRSGNGWCNECRGDANVAYRRAKGEKEKRRRNPALLAQGLKECFKCDRVLPLDAFYNNKDSADGRAPNCKECVSARAAQPEQRQKHSAKVRVRRKDNPDYQKKHRAQQGKRRAWKLGLDTGLVTGEFLDRLYATKRCAYCGQSTPQKDRTMDHVVPLARGGLHHPDNLVMACGSCNSRKRHQTGDEFREKLRRENAR